MPKNRIHRFRQQHTDEPEEERIQDQLLLIEKGDMEVLGVYLSPLIEDVLDFYDATGDRRAKLRNMVVAEIPRAVRLYQERTARHEVRFQFATYFTWFAKEKIEGTLRK